MIDTIDSFFCILSNQSSYSYKELKVPANAITVIAVLWYKRYNVQKSIAVCK